VVCGPREPRSEETGSFSPWLLAAGAPCREGDRPRDSRAAGFHGPPANTVARGSFRIVPRTLRTRQRLAFAADSVAVAVEAVRVGIGFRRPSSFGPPTLPVRAMFTRAPEQFEAGAPVCAPVGRVSPV
jgi:hypothetical protein